jgi:hypothetical protein
MNDNKISVEEALRKLYDLSWMVGSTAVEYLTDRDGETIREYVGVIEDRINDLEEELSEFKKYFEPYDIDEDNQTVIENGQAMTRGLRAGAGVIDPKIVEPINQVGLPNILSEKEIEDVSKNSR